MTAIDGKAFIAGQVSRATPMAWDFLSVVDVYDASADVWYSTDLSQERAQLAAVAVDNKAMFAGGLQWFIATYDIVDIYEELGTEYCIASPNSTGRGAEMFVVGSMMISDDSLALRSGPIPNTLSFYVYSPFQAEGTPYWD